MVHVVFGSDDAEALRKSYDLDESMAGELIVMDEDWSIGPLMGTINSDGETTSRNEWLARLFRLQPSEEGSLQRIKKAMNDEEEEELWIWIAPNARDVCGYYHLVSNLENFKGRLYTLWLNNLPFINDKGQIFYPQYLSEIPAKEFVKARRLAQQVSGATFETDPDEWKKMQRENKMVRVLEGAKKISGRAENFADKDLLQQISGDWQKSGKVIQNVSAKLKHAVGKAFLVWRLREMIGKNELEGKGDWPVADNFEVRKASTQTMAT